jgi:hypothetical protein
MDPVIIPIVSLLILISSMSNAPYVRKELRPTKHRASKSGPAEGHLAVHRRVIGFASGRVPRDCRADQRACVNSLKLSRRCDALGDTFGLRPTARGEWKVSIASKSLRLDTSDMAMANQENLRHAWSPVWQLIFDYGCGERPIFFRLPSPRA